MDGEQKCELSVQKNTSRIHFIKQSLLRCVHSPKNKTNINSILRNFKIFAPLCSCTENKMQDGARGEICCLQQAEKQLLLSVHQTTLKMCAAFNYLLDLSSVDRQDKLKARYICHLGKKTVKIAKYLKVVWWVENSTTHEHSPVGCSWLNSSVNPLRSGEPVQLTPGEIHPPNYIQSFRDFCSRFSRRQNLSLLTDITN